MDDAAHNFAVESLPFMDETQDDDDVYRGLLEEVFYEERRFV